jgi:hypothetical protein
VLLYTVLPFPMFDCSKDQGYSRYVKRERESKVQPLNSKHKH